MKSSFCGFFFLCQQDLVRNEYDKKCQENEELSLNYCTALLVQLEDTLKPDNDYMTPGGYQDFQQDLEALIVQYRDTKGRGIKVQYPPITPIFGTKMYVNHITCLLESIFIIDGIYTDITIRGKVSIAIKIFIKIYISINVFQRLHY